MSDGIRSGRELDARGGKAEDRAERLDQFGLGEPGHADQQSVSAGEDGDQRPVDDRLLAVDDLADRVAGGLDLGDGGLGLGEDLVGIGGEFGVG